MRKFVLVFLLFLPFAISASEYKQIETDHTTIIFEEQYALYAQEIASFADEVYENLAEYLAYESKQKVPVILVGKTAWANGYYTAFPASIYLYLTSPDNRFLGSRTASWLRSLYTHELTHYLHLNAKVGPAKVLRFLGPGVAAFNTVFMPGWWVEGITTHTETVFSEGGRGDSLPFALTYQIPLQEDSLWSLSQGAYNGPFTPSSRIYITGYLMVDYLIRTYGVEAFNTINRKFAAFPFLGLSPAFRKVTGHTTKELFTFALEDFKKPFEIVVGELISKEGQGNSYLPNETNLGVLGFRESPYDGSALYLYDMQGTHHVLSLPISGRSSISFSWDTAIFSMEYSDSTNPTNLEMAPVSYSDVYLLDLESKDITQLTEGQRLVHPSISYHGNRAVASRLAGPYYELVEINMENGSVKDLYKEERISLLEPALNADGNAIVCLRLDQGNSSIILLDEEGSVQTFVGPTQDELRSPLFTENGDILFIGEHEGSFGVYRCERRTGHSSKLFADPSGIFAARIIGDALIYETYTPEGIALKSVGMEQLTDEPAVFREPNAIVFEPQGENDYPMSSYRDHLRLNLVLPFPFVETNNVQPGIWFHSTSNLRKQSLIGSVGYSLQGRRPIADLVYQYAGGNYSLQLTGNLNVYDLASEEYLSNASVTIGLPLYHHVGISATHYLSLQPNLSVSTDWEDWGGRGSLSVGISHVERDYRSIDLYGPGMREGAIGVQAITEESFAKHRLAVYGSFSYQDRVFSGRQMIRIALNGVASSGGTVGSSYPLFSFKPLKDGDAKIRITTSYRLPLGLFDLPVLYGGLTKAGLELAIQSAWYLDEQKILWEDAWAVAVTLTGNFVMGGPSATYKPFIRFAYRFGQFDWNVTVGMEGQDLFNLFALPLDHARYL